jgi:hypothetical protein
MVVGFHEHDGQKQSTHKQPPKKEPYVTTLQVGKVYRQDDVYLKLIDQSHYVRLKHTEWSENPDNEAEPNRPSYVYNLGTYTRSEKQIQIGPTTHWIQIYFRNKKDRQQKKAETIWEFTAFQVKALGYTVKGFSGYQLRQHKDRWQIVEDPPGYLHPSDAKLPNTIEAEKNQFTTKEYKRFE